MSKSVKKKSTPSLPKRKLLIISLLIILGILELALIAWKLGQPKQASPQSSTSIPQRTASANKPIPIEYPNNEASSLWVVVNKGRVLPSTYAPTPLVVPNIPLNLSPSVEWMHMRKDAAKALEEMATSAAKQGVYLRLGSGYRSYVTQQATYSSEVKAYGQAVADSESARPGHSEHQTGLAADIIPNDRSCAFSGCFASTAEGLWLAKNASKYGFIIRYPKDKQSLTGFVYEPWHIRYIGKDLSAVIAKKGIILEQYFGLATSVSYPASDTLLKQ